jgi:hypothetical protein
MLQELTIHTQNRKLLKPLIEAAIETERKKVRIGLRKTQDRLAEFEREYGMTSAEFERDLIASKLDETIEFSDWRLEIGMLRLLTGQLEALENARLD